MHTVFIADDNKNWLTILELSVNREDDLTVVATAQNGKDALSYIEQFRPDVVIVDIVMSEYDGINIISYLRSHVKGYDPIIYVLSGIATNTVISALCDLGIDYFSRKPVIVESVIENLKSIIKNKKQLSSNLRDSSHLFGYTRDLSDHVTSVLRRLGMSPHLISTKFTVDILVLYLEHPDWSKMLSKALYPEVAKKYRVTTSAVEKNLRNAIIQMQQKNTEYFRHVFSYNRSRRISNSEFLTVAAKLFSEEDEEDVGALGGRV